MAETLTTKSGDTLTRYFATSGTDYNVYLDLPSTGTWVSHVITADQDLETPYNTVSGKRQIAGLGTRPASSIH